MSGPRASGDEPAGAGGVKAPGLWSPRERG